MVKDRIKRAAREALTERGEGLAVWPIMGLSRWLMRRIGQGTLPT